MRFDYESLPGRVRFGAGTAAAALADEISRGSFGRAMVLCSSREAPRAASLSAALGARLACTFSDVRQHVPIASAEAARSTDIPPITSITRHAAVTANIVIVPRKLLRRSFRVDLFVMFALIVLNMLSLPNLYSNIADCKPDAPDNWHFQSLGTLRPN
jgi:hypothetical protein